MPDFIAPFDGNALLVRSMRQYLTSRGADSALADDLVDELGATEIRLRDRGELDAIMDRLAADPELKIFTMQGSRSNGRAPAANSPMSLGTMIGESVPMQALKLRVRRLLEAEKRAGDNRLAPIMITGETGTGKKLLAHALHFEGARKDGPFVKVNCAALTPRRFDVEMFGHDPDGAVPGGEPKVGLLEAADGGTLFLDEVGELDRACQTRLLKLIEDPILPRIDGSSERRVDFRLVATTNLDLERMVHEGEFRSDLYFRLCVVTLAMPALRTTGDDILRIADYYLQRQGARYGRSGLRFVAGAKARLLAYGWPGNVRELCNKMEQVALLAQGELIDAAQIPIPIAAFRHLATPPSLGGSSGESDKAVHDQEAMVRQTLEQTDWNVARSARLLGLSRDIMRNRIKKFGLVRPVM